MSSLPIPQNYSQFNFIWKKLILNPKVNQLLYSLEPTNAANHIRQ